MVDIVDLVDFGDRVDRDKPGAKNAAPSTRSPSPLHVWMNDRDNSCDCRALSTIQPWWRGVFWVLVVVRFAESLA